MTFYDEFITLEMGAFMNGNNFMAWMLRSPFHRILSGGMMLITVTGRKTGKKYTTPVEYFLADGSVWVLTSRNRTWWRNLRDNPEIELLIKRNPVRGRGELVLESKQVELRLMDYLHHAPMAAKPMGIRVENKIPNAEDVARLAGERLFVRIELLN
ncbi:MAG: hypothetical protein OHK003_13640 [Anaerolineales bacterium]